VIGAEGDLTLERLVLRDCESGATETVPATMLFVLIGAEPHTDWLAGTVQRDRSGFLLTGVDVDRRAGWPLERRPVRLETSMPGVYAVGDVRHGSYKRVASAVGEGAVVVPHIHEYLVAPVVIGADGVALEDEALDRQPAVAPRI
jgi:thioredoxin reductase (NADPH)